MKLTLPLLVTLGSSVDPQVKLNRSVPPRHPANRLARLNQFCISLVDETGWINPKRTKGMTSLCNNWSGKLNEKIGTECFFYSPDVSNGGPEPGVEPELPKDNVYHPKWNTGTFDWMPANRRRRNEDELVYYDSPFKTGPRKVQAQIEGRDDYIHPDWLDPDEVAAMDSFICDDDCAENGNCANDCPQLPVTERGAGDKKLKRLQNQGPWKGARSILTGFRKWAERYVSQCHGHRRGNHMHRRTRYIAVISNKYLKHCDHEECNREYLDSKKFKWGRKNLNTYYKGK